MSTETGRIRIGIFFAGPAKYSDDDLDLPHVAKKVKELTGIYPDIEVVKEILEERVRFKFDFLFIFDTPDEAPNLSGNVTVNFSKDIDDFMSPEKLAVTYVIKILMTMNDRAKGFRETFIIPVKIYFYSSRKTRKNYYKCISTLMVKAICNQTESLRTSSLSEPNQYDKTREEPFYLFAWIKLATMFLKSCFTEKRWKIGTALMKRLSLEEIVGLRYEEIKRINSSCVVESVADPFFLKDGYVVAEVISKRVAMGKIKGFSLSDDSTISIIPGRERHFAYPQVVGHGDRFYMLPEVAEHSSPSFYVLHQSDTPPYHPKVVGVIPVRGLEGLRMSDATYHYDSSSKLHWIFASPRGFEPQLLNLYYSKEFMGAYQEHPLSPVVTNCFRARMAGNLMEIDGKLLRFAQDGSNKYGDGISICEIVELTTDSYREVHLATLKFSGVRGPHTLNCSKRKVVVDYYDEYFSLFSGLYRLSGAIKRLTQ